MRRSRPPSPAGLPSLFALALGAACGREAPPPPPWHQEAGHRWRDLAVDGTTPGFTTMDPGDTRVRFTNDVSDSVLLGNRMLGQGAGVALGDVDGDGRVDVFLGRTQGCSALYRNLGGWRFEDVTRAAGVGACDRHTAGVALADVDGDRDLDLVLVATTGPNAIFVNDGRGKFAERRDLGLDPAGRGGTTVALADVDGDGTLDLYVANYKAYSPVDTIAPQERAPNQIVRRVGPDRYEVVPERQNDFKLVTRPDMGGTNLTMRAEPDALYLNAGGRFAAVPLTGARWRDAKGDPLGEAAESFTLSARFADLNGDGAPDLYVANDFEDPDLLWWNDGRGNFRLADWTALRQTSNSTMGVDVGDVDGDGRPDLFETDMLSDDTRRLKTQMPMHTALPKTPGDAETVLQQQRNSLFVNRGDGTFAEVSAMAGVQASGWSWGTLFLDVDLDGRQDLLVATGHLWDIMDADVQERQQRGLAGVDWRRKRWQFPTLKLRNVAFRNAGDLSFESAGERWRFGAEEDISHALASADLDGDGDLDVVVNRLRSPALLLRNDAPGARVAVRLVGRAPNTMAVGATIRLTGGAAPLQVREVAAGGLYLSHSDYAASFAMGDARAATIEVTWRDGTRTTVRDVAPNRLYEIEQPGLGARDSVVGKVFDDRAPTSEPRLFDDATASLGGHAHTETPFDDWERQFLLPNALSQLGPGASWADVDGDGDDDLVIGAGRGGRLGVFRNDRGRLVPQPGGAPLPDDATTVLGDAAGGRLVVGVSGWEVSRAPAALGMRGARGAAEALLPAQESAVGPLALGDVDGDGDLDLFVGGRALPSRYPTAASSALWRNDGGRFVLDSVRSQPLGGVGLVSAASFADIDGDGDADLLLAREWDTVLLLRNEGGRLVPAPLSPRTSRWNGLATGDLDGDGRLDVVATSWGRNTVTPADSARPLVLLHGPFGAGGEEETLLARFDPRVRGLSTLNGFARLRVAMPDVASRLGTYAAYADATAEQVLGPRASRVRRDSATTLDHTAFLNRGDHFVAVPLPAESQVAPSFGVAVADFDGDGAEDVFLAQNFFPTAVGIPRYDAGRGLLLKGDGRGGLRPLSGAESGIVSYGDQRGAAYADYDGDGRLDLALAQNAGPTRLFHNRGATPGLRVRLVGPASNPTALGAQLRVVYGDRMGPVREVQSGSGYWSQNGAVQVLGLAATPTAVWVRWSGGRVTTTPVPAGAREVMVGR